MGGADCVYRNLVGTYLWGRKMVVVGVEGNLL